MVKMTKRKIRPSINLVLITGESAVDVSIDQKILSKKKEIIEKAESVFQNYLESSGIKLIPS
ncbi:MAG: hypothetical protein K0A89_07750 [ANME-2 cluster archaeon]|nr:hypothetical protein [ANME-2 cluster archaeon]